MVKLKTVYSEIEPTESIKFHGVKEPSQKLIDSILKAKDLWQKACDYIAEVFKIGIEEEGYTKKEIISLLSQNGFSQKTIYRYIPLEYQSNEKGAGRKQSNNNDDDDDDDHIEIVQEQKIQDAEIVKDIEETYTDLHNSNEEKDFNENEDFKHFRELQKKNNKTQNVIKDVYQPASEITHNVENVQNGNYVEKLQKQVNDLKLHILKLESPTRKVKFDAELDLSGAFNEKSGLTTIPVSVTCMVNSGKCTVVINMEKLKEMVEDSHNNN